jgi:hypothetical protein
MIEVLAKIVATFFFLFLIFSFFFPPRTRLKGNVEKTEAVEKTLAGERTPENATYM